MNNQLTLKYIGIDTYKEAVIYIHKDSPICKSEGFEVPSRIQVSLGNNSILATLNTVSGELLGKCEASLSQHAWNTLKAKSDDIIQLSHPKPLQSLSYLRGKIYNNSLNKNQIQHIISDITKGRYSDIHIATFLTACAGGRLNEQEIIDITNAMVSQGQCLNWSDEIIVDKHCVGGLPGNRTTLIIVPIVTAFGLTMPKTSSRAITSPAGSADTMEVIAPVSLSTKQMRNVVEKEGGCIVWGGNVNLSPADELLIRVERAIDLDSEGQLVASVLSKKISAGSNHLVIDIPTGPTAKIRSREAANTMEELFESITSALNISTKIHISDGLQPVGKGIGPSLEARDVLAVLQNKPNAPKDLRNRALTLAGSILEFSPSVKPGTGKQIATQLLTQGKAWLKFQQICEAQGGMKKISKAKYTHEILSKSCGRVISIDNRQLARLAKLAGAPKDKAAGLVLHTPLNTLVESGQPIFTIHAESKSELNYALSALELNPEIIQLEASE